MCLGILKRMEEEKVDRNNKNMDDYIEEKFGLISSIVDLILLAFTITTFILSMAIDNYVLTRIANTSVMVILGLVFGNTLATFVKRLKWRKENGKEK